MVFSSLLFTFLFLPLVVLLYYFAKEEYRNYLLLAASLLFYSYGEPVFVLVMVASIVVNYGLALGIDVSLRQSNTRLAKMLLIGDVLTNLGLLFVFKYLNMAVGVVKLGLGIEFPYRELAMPIGISFFTFQALSYVVDVYREKVPVQKNPFYVALYISFFPQLIAGPIVRYESIAAQIEKRSVNLEMFAEGVRRFMLGFCKKIILANNLSVVAKECFERDMSLTNPTVAWIGSICFSLQILYDFSGYSDMAIGLGKMFGFQFEENFDYPYISKTATEFWRRWHISLGRWFRDYVYIPLGGSKVGPFRHLMNLCVVWLLTGLWHGAKLSFLAWAMGYFVLQLFEKYVLKPEKKGRLIGMIWQIFVLFCVNFGWVLFNAEGLKKGLVYCIAMLGGNGVRFAIDGTVIRYWREYGAYMIAGILFATPVVKVLEQKIATKNVLACAYAVVRPVAYGILFLWAVSFLILGVHNPFIYFIF